MVKMSLKNKLNIKDTVHVRSLTMSVSGDDDNNIEIAFASKYPVNRGGFIEVLDLSGMDLSRLNNNAQVLFNHHRDYYVGVVKNARVDADGIARAQIKFASSEKAKEIEADVRGGILTSISFGYYVRDYVESGDTVVVTDLEPFEISIVTVPADPHIGVGRSLENVKTYSKEDSKMSKNEEVNEKAVNSVTVTDETHDLLKKERSRVTEISAIGDKFGKTDMARSFIENGKTLEEFREAVLGSMNNVRKVTTDVDENIGMTENETKRFSLARAFKALANPKDIKAQEAAAFEFEASRAVQAKLGKEARGLMLPYEVMNRAMSVGTATAGGNTVSTDLMTGSMIDLLRNKSFVMQIANILNGLQGDISIPRQTGGATGYWVAEDAKLTTSDGAFDLVNMTPKSLGGTTYATRKLQLQSDLMIDSFIQRELATTLALELDRAAFNGSGAGAEPTGVLNTTGIGSVAIGVNGGAITRNAVIDLESAITSANADLGNLRFITNSAVRGAMRKNTVDAGSGEFLFEGSDLLGYEALFTNQIPSNLTKGTSSGVCSAMLFGNFQDLLIGLWSGIDIVVDPYTYAKQGGLEITAFQDCDIAVRHPESFSAVTDITTA